MSSSEVFHQSHSHFKQLAELLCATNETTELLGSLEWAEFLDLANQHCVQALLFHFLQQTSHWPSIPESVRKKLTTQNRAQCAVEMRKQQEVQNVLDALNADGIQYLLMKGTPLAYSLYQEPHHRIRSDTDILFPDRETAEQAWLVLEKLGYSHSTTTMGDYVGYQFYCLREISPGIYSNLDCHIKLNDYLFFAHAFEFEELSASSTRIPEIAESARGLGPVHALLLACMHRIASLPSKEVDRLSWLYDIHLLAASFDSDQWSEFLTLAIERRIAFTCHITIERAMEFFPIEIPESILGQLETAAEKEPFKPTEDMKKWQFYLASLRSLPGIRKKAQLIREHLFPPFAYMRHKYQTDNNLLLPYLYIHRVFSGLGKYF